jgi:hypothetical protein
LTDVHRFEKNFIARLPRGGLRSSEERISRFGESRINT